MTPSPAPRPALATALMLLASSLIAGTSLLAKLVSSGALGAPLHPLQVSQGRFLFGLVAVALAALALRPHFTRPAVALHLARSTAGWGGVSLMFAAVAFIPLTDATAISFLNPVFAMLLAMPILGETVGRVRWTAAAVALAGALILLRPGPESFEPAALLALGAAMALGFEITLIKMLSGREGPVQILLINNGIGAAIASAAAAWVWQDATLGQWLALAALGTMMVGAQGCYVNALRLADASFVAPLSYATLVFAAVYDRVIFGVVPDAVTAAGAAIIVAGAATLAWREAQARKRLRA